MSPGKFVYAEWRKWDKAVENFLSAKFNIRGISLAYVNRKDDAPVKIIFDHVAYDVNLEDFRINTAPLTVAVFKRAHVEFHKFLKSLTQDTKAWKRIEKSKGGRDDMKALRENYYGSAEVECCMNITKADLKDLYFKQQDVLPFEKYVNGLK